MAGPLIQLQAVGIEDKDILANPPRFLGFRMGDQLVQNLSSIMNEQNRWQSKTLVVIVTTILVALLFGRVLLGLFVVLLVLYLASK